MKGDTRSVTLKEQPVYFIPQPHQSIKQNNMNPNNKVTLDQFQLWLDISYKNFCDTHQLDYNAPQTFITYLVDHNLIKGTTIRRYTILKEFNQLHRTETDKNKSELVRLLAKRFNLSQRSIYTILKEYKRQFERNHE